MSKRVLPSLRWSSQLHDYRLTAGSSLLSAEITASHAAWVQWLATIPSFSFEDQQGMRSTIRKEHLQRGDVYWYAYRSVEGKTRKRYLGRTADLSFLRLEEVSSSFPTEKQEQLLTFSQEPENLKLFPLLESKLHPPRLSGLLIERPRLFDWLEPTLLHPITLLQAPAGSGKTTVLNQWLRSHADFPPVAWVTLDGGDNDLTRFWRYLIAACEVWQEPGQKYTQALSALEVPFGLPDMDRVLALFLNELTRQKQQKLLLLDDYYLITEPRIHETLTFFLQHLPANVQVFLLTRTEPPLPLLRWRAEGILCEPQAVDLRFTWQETATFLRQSISVPLSDALVTSFDHALEGWATGLRLLGLSLQRNQTEKSIEQALHSLRELSEASLSRQMLMNYFVTEILVAQPESMQQFLFQTSIFSRFNASLCNAITGDTDGQEQLEAVERAGLFLETLDGEGMWYRYHPLFAGAMRVEANRRLGEAQLQTFSLRACQWYEQAGLMPEAVEAALLAGDRERMAGLIERLVEDGHFYETQTVIRWLEPMPESVFLDHPHLCLILATELRFYQDQPPIPDPVRAQVERLLHTAEDGWQRQGKDHALGLIWAFRALDHLKISPYAQVVFYAKKALAIFADQKINYRMQLWRGGCLLVVGMEMLCKGQVGEAHELLLQVVTQNQGGYNSALILQALLLLAKSHFIQGELYQAKSYCGQTLREAKAMKMYDHAIEALLDTAWLEFEWNDLDAAKIQIEEAIELVPLSRYQRAAWLERAALQLALIEYVQNQIDFPQQQITSSLMNLLTIQMPDYLLLLASILNWQVQILLQHGDFQAVEDLLAKYSQSDQAQYLVLGLGIRMLKARLLLAQGEVQEALLTFERLRLEAKAHLHHYNALVIDVQLVLALAASDQHQQALQLLQSVLLQTQKQGLVRLFLNQGKPLARLLRSLETTIQDKELRSYLQTILRAFVITPKTEYFPQTSADELFFEPLSAQEQRVLQLLSIGMANKDIAQELIISLNTVKSHIKNIYRKLGVNNRLQANAAARDLHLL